MANEALITIKPVLDTSEIESSLQELNRTGTVSDGAATAYKSGNAELQKRNTLMKDTNVISAKLQQATAAVSGELIKQAAAGIKVDSTLDKYRLTIADTSKTISGVLVSSSKQYGAVLMDNAGKIEKQTTSMQSLKAEKRALAAQIAQLLLEGKKESAMYQELVQRAGDIDDAISDANASISRAGSDTRGLDNTLQLASGITAAFSIAEGAAGLFGAENEDLQKALLKVNGAMAILNGLQQIQAIVRDENILSLVAETRARLVNNAQILVENGLQSRSIIVRGLATAAQWALNVAMTANPVGILVVGIAALTTALFVFTQTSKEAAEAQKELADAENATFQATQNQLAIINSAAESNIRRVEQELKLAQARGASFATIYAIEEKLGTLRQSLAARNKGYYAEEIANVGLYRANLEGLYATQGALAAQTDDESKKQKEALDARIQNVEAKLKVATDAENAYTDAIAQNTARQLEYQQTLNAASLKGAKAYIEAKLAKAVEGSAQELKLREDLLIAERRIALSDVNLQQGERLAIIAKSERAIADLKKKYRQDNAKADMDLEAAKASSWLESATLVFGQYSDEAIAAKTTQLVTQANLEKQAVDQSIDTEAHKAERIQLINDNLNRALATMDAELNRHKLEDANRLEDSLRSLAVSRLRIKEDDPNLNELQRFRAAQQRRLAEMEGFREQEKQLDKKYQEDANYSTEQYLADMTGLIQAEDDKQAEIDRAAAQRRIDLWKEVARATIQIVTEAANASFEVDKAKRDATLQLALDNLDKEKQQALDNKNITESQKKAIEIKYAADSKRLKLEAARRDKDAAKAQAIVSGALAIVQSFAQLGPIGGAIAAVIVAATTAIQIAKINATPLPAYAKGTKSAPPGMAWVGEEGPELVQFKGGEAVHTAKNSQAIYDSWAASIPAQDPDIMSAWMVNSQGALQIDYDKLGKAVADNIKIPETTVVENTIDSDGLHSYMRKGDSRTEIKNNRYTH